MFKQVTHLRNNTLFSSLEAAKTAMNGQLTTNAVDGSIILGRYSTGSGTSDVATLIGAVAKDVQGKTNISFVTTLEDLEVINQRITSLIGQEGNTMQFPGSTPIIAGDDDVKKALIDLANAASINISTRDSEVISSITNSDGTVVSTPKNLSSVKLEGLSTSTSKEDIAAADTLGLALRKLQNQINDTETLLDGLDYNSTTDSDSGYVAGKPLVTVTQTNGQVDSTYGNINAEYVTVASDKFTSDNVKGALVELANTIEDIGGEAKSYKITDVTPAGVNTEHQYRLDVKVGTGSWSAASDSAIITVPKDSSLANVYLGHVDDTLQGEDSTTHESASSTVVNGTGEEALCFVNQLANGNYKLTKISVGDFLKESEFKDGLVVSNTGEVSVKLSTATESQKYLRFDSDKAVEVYGIDAAIATEKARAQAAETEIANKVGLTGAEKSRTWTPTTNYGGSTTTVKDNMQAIDTALKAVQDGYLKGVKVNNKTASVDNNRIASVTVDGGDIALTGYSEDTASIQAETQEANLQIADTDTVNQAVAKLYRTIELDERTIAAGLVDLDSRLQEVEQEVATPYTEGNGININNKVISVELDDAAKSSTAKATADAYVDQTNGNVLQLSSEGLYLSNVWDCGTY